MLISAFASRGPVILALDDTIERRRGKRIAAKGIYRDSGLSALLFLDAMRRGGITAITRLRLDAALYEPAPPRPPGTIGRPRTKGARLPSLSDVLVDASTGWQATVVPGWYLGRCGPG